MARPIEFDYDSVLENAMQQFWQEGYEASSVQKLLDATGINRGTLYNSFGDKDTFFILCVDRYNKKLKENIGASLSNSKLLANAAIEAYIKNAIHLAPTKQRMMGCLLVNSVCESINLNKDLQKLIRKSLSTVQKSFLRRTRELAKAKQLKRGLKAEQAAEVLMNLLQGLYLSARNGRSPKLLGETLKIGLESIKK
ncbi:MAG: TetR/AcrR family transcriptional regulator [Gammaproteobacteria bacterium]|jgi:TetR/AcrR family transcriptional regulator, transcriptional repressor for nem operon|nr:TetR/AcrR family transcriptional regulator [Gammaproteobacteria bacterium]